jgi:hypothetical protein
MTAKVDDPLPLRLHAPGVRPAWESTAIKAHQRLSKPKELGFWFLELLHLANFEKNPLFQSLSNLFKDKNARIRWLPYLL